MDFFHLELIDQVQAGHITISPLATVSNLNKVQLTSIILIPQSNRPPRIIYDFTWSSRNTATDMLAPQEVMRFRNSLNPTIGRVIEANTALCPFHLSKLDLASTYMRLWFLMKDAPSLALFIPKKHLADIQLIGFHLALPTGYIGSTDFSCTTTNTATYMANDTIS